jgi:hypothetical protein
MSTRIKALLAFTMITGAFAASSAAEARDWFPFRFYQPRVFTYYPDPDEYDPYLDDREYYDQRNGYYDPQYDEPRYVKPRKKKKTAKIVPKENPAPKKSAAVAPKKAAKPTQQASRAVSCEKAGKIILDYGFSSVKPTSCAGQVYAFNATRGGKPYVVRLSSASGELTEVKKVQ